MNKILQTSICALALTSVASAFTLDITSLNGKTLGNETVTHLPYGDFVFSSNDSLVVANNTINLNQTETLKIVYPSSVTYVGAFVIGNTTVVDNDVVKNVIFIASENGVALNTFTFTENIPEPSSTALLGLGGLAFILRRRK